MDVVFFLLPVSLVLAGIALLAFLWSAKDGQFDDLETPAHRMLNDDEENSPADPEIED